WEKRHAEGFGRRDMRRGLGEETWGGAWEKRHGEGLGRRDMEEGLGRRDMEEGLGRRVSAEQDGGPYVFQGYIQSRDYGQFGLQRQGQNITETTRSSEAPPGTNSSSVAVAILVPFFALIFAGFGFYLYKQRRTDKAEFSGCSVHENSNGQATFENPMYNTNTKSMEGKVVRFDPSLNTVCTMV
ncbi:CUB and sushi domain-containing protein 3, partial [Tachysurus ichikawai]